MQNIRTPSRSEYVQVHAGAVSVNDSQPYGTIVSSNYHDNTRENHSINETTVIVR